MWIFTARVFFFPVERCRIISLKILVLLSPSTSLVCGVSHLNSECGGGVLCDNV